MFEAPESESSKNDNVGKRGQHICAVDGCGVVIDHRRVAMDIGVGPREILMNGRITLASSSSLMHLPAVVSQDGEVEEGTTVV